MQNKKIVLSALILVFLLVGLFGSTFLVGQVQEIRKKAFPSYQPTATLELKSSSVNPQIEEDFSVDVLINTQGQSVVSVEMALEYSDNLEYQGNQATCKLSQFTCHQNKIFPENRVIQVGAITQQGTTFTVGSATPFATLQFKALAAGPAQISFQKAYTHIFPQGSDLNILKTPSDLSFTVGAGVAEPTLTPIPTPTTPAGNTSVEITNVTEDQILTTKRPLFSGSAAPDADLTITVESDPVVGTAKANVDGDWFWNTPADLSNGSHRITIIAKDAEGNSTTTTLAFNIQVGNENSASPATATPTSRPTPTPTSALKGATPPTPGIWQNTAALLVSGLFLIILGARFLLI